MLKSKNLSENSLGIFSKLNLITKPGVCNNLTDQGKAVFNKNEYGCQLLAQSDGSNVLETSLVNPNMINIRNIRTKIINLRKIFSDFLGNGNIRSRDIDMEPYPNISDETMPQELRIKSPHRKYHHPLLLWEKMTLPRH